jgi:hypothetical protein
MSIRRTALDGRTADYSTGEQQDIREEADKILV